MFKSLKIPNIFFVVILTWQAQNFVPADYLGKILPTTGAPIKVGLEMVNENKIQNLAQTNIRWYIDEKLLTQGLGLKQIFFRATQAPTYSHLVRSVIQTENEIDATTEIPIVNPKVIIKAPNFAAVGKNLLQAIPYFFNINNLNDLVFNWNVNNQTVQGNNFLQLELTPPIPTNNNLDIKVMAKNLNNDLEFSSKEINLSVQQ